MNKINYLDSLRLVNSAKNLLEWAKGYRGRKDINPYMVPEVKEMIKLLAEITGWDGAWEDFPTNSENVQE